MKFIQKYAKIDGDSEGEELIDEEEARASDEEFIDDLTIFQDQNPSDCCGLKNVTRSLDDTINDRSCADTFDDCSDPGNYTPECFDEAEINHEDFNGFEKRVDNFKKDLKIFEGQSNTHFAMRFRTRQFSNCAKKKTFIPDENEKGTN